MLENTRAGSNAISIKTHLSSVKSLDITFLNTKTNKQIIKLKTNAIIVAAVVDWCSFVLFFSVTYFAVNLLTINGKPLEISVNKNIKIEQIIWYIPNDSVPIVLLNQILKTKPARRVSPVKNIIIKTVLNKDFISYFINGGKLLCKLRKKEA